MQTINLFKVFSLLLCLLCFDALAQQKIGKIWSCQTVSPSKDYLKSISALTVTNDTTPKIINVFTHIIRQTDGSAGLTNDQVNDWISRLCNDYRQHQIMIRETGRSYLNSTTYYGGITDANYSTLISTDTHTDAIDMYLLSPNDSYSRASGVPGIALAVGGSYQGTSVLSHELGHCLGLYHAHSGRGCNDAANCSENTDESNCSTCGDLICDTPADPCLSGNVDENCNYIGNNSFHPDVHNIMSYAPPTCLSRITVGQTLRIHSTILNSSIFSSRSYKPNVTGPSLVCSSVSTFTLNNLPSGYTVSWTNSTNLTLSSSSGNTAVFYAIGSGTGFIQATVNSTCGSIPLPQHNVWVGEPPVPSLYSNQSYTIYVSGDIYIYDANVDTYGGLIQNNFQWTWDSDGACCIYPMSAGSAMFYGAYAGSFRIRASAENACGSTGWSDPVVVDVIEEGFMLSPNPASEHVEVTIAPEASKTAIVSKETVVAKTYSVRIFNSYGTQVYSSQKLGNKFNIPTSNLNDGVYVVEVSDGKNVNRKQLVVKKN